jgi:predicted DsbA family dithiol-disulfide isomerase
VQKASAVGLDPVRAQAVLASDEFAAEVRQAEHFYTSHGIQSVPAIILNGQHLISGGQPPEVFEKAIRQVASEAASNS